MWLYITDDCNSSWDERMDFFLYGGIVVNEDEAKELSKKILLIKRDMGIKKERPIKWTNNNWRGQGILDEGKHAEIKQKVLDLISNSKAKIIVCLSPQDFYHNRELRDGVIRRGADIETKIRTSKFSLNDALKKFNEFLEKNNGLGMVLADEFGDDIRNVMQAHCFEIFPDGTSRYALDKIIHPVIRISNENSHLHQINDVVLGAIYYSLREAEQNFLPFLKGNFWREREDDYSTSLGKGFNIYPLIATHSHIRRAKENLRSKFLRQIE